MRLVPVSLAYAPERKRRACLQEIVPRYRQKDTDPGDKREETAAGSPATTVEHLHETDVLLKIPLHLQTYFIINWQRNRDIYHRESIRCLFSSFQNQKKI